MSKEFKRSYKLTMLVAVLCLIVIVGSTTYAYFKTRISGSGTKIDISGKTFDLNINENSITLNSLKPIYDTDKATKANIKTFTVSGGGVSSGCVSIYLTLDSIGTNLVTRFLKYELLDGSTLVSAGDFSGRSVGSSVSLAKNISLSDLSSKSYTLRIWLSYDADTDQSSILTGTEADRTLQAHLKAVGTTGACKELTLKDAILKDNISVSERTSFTSTNVANTTGTIYKTNKTEDSSDVYYYSGNTTNNWVKFGKETRGTCSYNNNKVTYVETLLEFEEKDNDLLESECTTTNICASEGIYYVGLDADMCANYDGTIIEEKATFNPYQLDIYWRIIRSNEDGSVRLLYFGVYPDTTEPYIGASYFNDNSYVGQSGYMYDLYVAGYSTDYDEIRANTTDSTIKKFIDTWYEKNLLSNYDKYISKAAIYCNDRSIKDKDNFSLPTRDSVGAYIRKESASPSYKCGVDKDNNLIESTQAVADKFSASTTGGGNGQLKYPIALMTVDEISFASISSTRWYNTNSNSNSDLNNIGWWLLSPSSYNLSSQVYNIGSTGAMNDTTKPNEFYAVRPVISLASCVKVTGSGTTTDPYIVNESASTC